MEQPKKTEADIVDEFTDDDIIIYNIPVDFADGNRMSYGSRWRSFVEHSE
jgi:hypothetical protein